MNDQNSETRILEDESKPSSRLAPGIRLAERYQVEEVIGIGGMGAVYRARDWHFPNVTKWVAVKEMINPSHEPALRETLVQNFEREANILATLSHPAVPRIYDFFTHAQRSYLVLEFIQGEDMENYLRRSPDPISQERVIQWAIELCDVLEYLHTHQPEPIIFRDMKPSNVMINQFNQIVLVDFGIAKAFKMGQRGTMMGTEGYSPPEQYRGEATPLVDIYALGATLHQMLTRCNPQHEAPFTFSERPIKQYYPSVSPELEAIILRAVEYMPEDRYQSAGEMRKALSDLSRRLGVPTLPTPPPSVPILREDERTPLWSFECEDEVRGSPIFNGGMLYFGAYDNNLYCLDAGTGEFLWKYPTRGAVVGRPAISESFVYFGSEDSYLHVITALTGRMLWTYRTDGPIRSSPCISGEYLFIGSDDAQLHAVNLKTGRRVWTYETTGPVRSTPSCEDNLVYFGSEGGDFTCLDILGTQKWHFHAKRAVTSSPLIYDQRVYFASMDGNFYAIDAHMGWEVWRLRMGKGSISSPCMVEKYLYLGCVDGTIFCIDANTTREVWSFRTDHQVTGSPVGYKDRILCGSVDGGMYCLDYKTGRLHWKFNTGSPITGTPVVMGDAVYFGSTNHRVYALPI